METCCSNKDRKDDNVLAYVTPIVNREDISDVRKMGSAKRDDTFINPPGTSHARTHTLISSTKGGGEERGLEIHVRCGTGMRRRKRIINLRGEKLRASLLLVEEKGVASFFLPCGHIIIHI